MPLPDDIRDLADRILGRLEEAQEFYLHTREAWRVVQQIAHEGRSVGIVDRATGEEVPAPDLEPMAQRYVTVHLSESTFKGLSGLLEDWIVGLARLWLTAYPRQLDAAYSEAAERSRSQRREEIQVPLSEILAAPDRGAILRGVIERVVRELAYRRPSQWFQFFDNRVNLGCPDESQRGALCELKAARDVLEHGGGLVGLDYIDKAGTFARHAEGATIQIDEPYLLNCFALIREVFETMAAAAIRRSSGSSPS
jgi:hypothetical protein